jgi:hypothetical protein
VRGGKHTGIEQLRSAGRGLCHLGSITKFPISKTCLLWGGKLCKYKNKEVWSNSPTLPYFDDIDGRGGG